MESNGFVERSRERLIRKARKYRARMSERLRPAVIKNRGVCPICECGATFVSRDGWLRDHYKCLRCKSIPRERALMLILQQHYPLWRDLTIHESSPAKRGASKRLASECHAYIPTQFYAHEPRGSIVDGFRCEDLEQLTFADASIDLHITQDVLEHIPRPAQAFAEIARTLKPGGAHIFTVPIVNKDAPSKPRIAMDACGDIVHLESPQYHGNPIDAKGALVTIDWGYDIREFIARSSGLATEIVRLDDLEHGLRAEYLEVLVTKK
jgi:SAM-dependent methyltransferase